jgi:hypothetical protein
VGAFAICPQLEAFSQDMRLTPLLEKTAPAVGTLWHAGAAYRYGALLPERPNWLVYPTPRDAVWTLGMGMGRQDLAEEALRLWDAYEQHYQFNAWRPVLVEHQFEVEMEGEPYTARIDLLAYDQVGALCLIDHKTRGRLPSDAAVQTEFQADRQMLTGVALARHAGYPVQRLVINVITRENPFPRFKRVDVALSQLAYERLGFDTRYYLKAMRETRTAYPDPTNRPRNLDSCFRKYGVCDFRPLCVDGLHNLVEYKKR